MKKVDDTKRKFLIFKRITNKLRRKIRMEKNFVKKKEKDDFLTVYLLEARKMFLPSLETLRDSTCQLIYLFAEI